VAATKPMSTRARAFGCAAIVATLCSSLSAQWPLHQRAGIPKTPDGKVDLNAPAPRMADGTPDLSGIWMAHPGPELNPPPGRPPLATFGNTGVGMQGDLPFQPWARDLQKKRALHLDPQPLKVVQTPAAIYIIYETNYGLRTIFMDGRSLPSQGQPQPFWYGYSVGRWESDTLVVETNNYRGDGWLDARGSPITEAATSTGRFRRVNYGQLDIEFTLNDPKAYTRSFTVRIDQRLMADGSELIEFICHENQQFLTTVKVD
jgi:hypothetical protein